MPEESDEVLQAPLPEEDDSLSLTNRIARLREYARFVCAVCGVFLSSSVSLASLL